MFQTSLHKYHLGPLWVVVEYAPFGNLRDYLRKKREQMLILKQQKTGQFNWNSEILKQSTEHRPFLTLLDLVDFAFQV